VEYFITKEAGTVRARKKPAAVYFARRMVCFALIVLLLAGGALLFGRSSEEPVPAESLDIWGTGAGESILPQEPDTPATPVSELYSAMWISYLEWESVDFSSEAASPPMSAPSWPTPPIWG
jgi:hypothetical protein